MIAHMVGGPLHGTDRDVDTKTSFTVYYLNWPSTVEKLEARTDHGVHLKPTVEECTGEYRRFFKGDLLSRAAGTDLPSIFLWVEQ